MSLKSRLMITIMSMGITDDSIRSHIMMGKQNGITKDEIVKIVIHLAFCAGWPKA